MLTSSKPQDYGTWVDSVQRGLSCERGWRTVFVVRLDKHRLFSFSFWSEPYFPPEIAALAGLAANQSVVKAYPLCQKNVPVSSFHCCTYSSYALMLVIVVVTNCCLWVSMNVTFTCNHRGKKKRSSPAVLGSVSLSPWYFNFDRSERNIVVDKGNWSSDASRNLCWCDTNLFVPPFPPLSPCLSPSYTGGARNSYSEAHRTPACVKATWCLRKQKILVSITSRFRSSLDWCKINCTEWLNDVIL